MNATRQFEDRPAVRERVPLLIGLVGPSSSGKTFSSLRLATGMQRVYGGEIFGIDTESDRMLHYVENFKFRHVPFTAPFGPLDYLAAIEHCINRGAKVIVIDSMSHEHSGPGGVMDQVEGILLEKCGEDYAKRERMGASAHVIPKGQRRKLNNAIVQFGSRAAFIFCYRADEKMFPKKLGWAPETTSKLHYDMVQRFLLPPGCGGVPRLTPELEAEKLLVKTPEQFKSYFRDGVQLSEDVGERLARWAAADTSRKLLIGEAEMLAAATPDELAAAWHKCRWRKGTDEEQILTDLMRRRKAEQLAAKPGKSEQSPIPGVDEDPVPV